MGKAKERNPAIDVVRIVALFLVVSVHFFLNIGYYKVTFEGERLFFVTVWRSLCKACVPLFILLTGYLMNRKQLSGRYYLGIVKTLGVYLLASVACILFKVFWLEQEVSVNSAVLGIFDFSAASYSWYVEMYICLFLLIPFINVMYHGMSTPGRKLALVGTFFFVSSAYTVFNIFDLHTPGWWADTTVSTVYDELVPDYLSNIYPISIYLVGCVLSDFKVKMRRPVNLLLLAVVTVGLGWYSYYRCLGRTFIWGHWQGDCSLAVVSIAVLLFIFISGFDLRRAPRLVVKGLKLISDSVLGAYLVSYIFDKLFYTRLNEAVPEIYQRYPYYFVVVPAVFVCSILLSILLNGIWWAITSTFAFIGKGLRRCLPKPSAPTGADGKNVK